MPTKMTQQNPDFELDPIQEARLYSETLRKTSDQAAADKSKGYMMGKYWIRDDDRGDLLKSITGAGLDAFYGGKEADLGAQREQQFKDFIKARPDNMMTQEVPAKPAVIGGPVGDGEGMLPPVTGEQLPTIPALPASTKRVMKPYAQQEAEMTDWATQGATIRHPLAQAMAQAGLTQALTTPAKGLEREEKARDRLAEINIRLADKALDRESKEALTREGNEIKRLLGEGQLAISRGMLDLKRSVEANKPKGPDGKPLTGAESKGILGAADAAKAYKGLAADFKPDFAGYGAVGDLARRAASILGSWAPDDTQAANKWWSEYEKLADLPERNAMFGSALTAPERALWDQARLIRPGADPKQVLDTVNKMEAVMRNKAARLGKAAVAGGRSPTAVGALLDDDFDPSQFEVVK